MATFLPNVTDVFAGSSDFDPDFNRIERMLNLRQGMYDQGAKKVKSLYDSIFNSQMIRKDNIQKRDAYLKTISDSLNKMSSTDLSIDANVQMANELFTPVITDQGIVHDISYTKEFQNENARVEQLRTSKDPTTQKQYWDIGKKALQYQAEEYANADKQTAIGMSFPKYTPNVDMLSLAEKAYKDAGISVKEDNINGGYVFTKKNGDAVFPIAQSFVNTLFQNDARVQDMIKTQTYVYRKDFIKQNATKYGGENQAAVAYIQDAFNVVGSSLNNSLKVDQKEVGKLQDKVNAWDDYIRDKGMVPDKNNEDYQKYLHDVEALEVSKKGVQNQQSVLNNLKLPSKIDDSNFNNLINQADNIVSNYNIGNFTTEIAKLLSFKDAELTVKADPIYLTKLHADLSLRTQSIMEGIRHTNSVDLENRKAHNQQILLQMSIDAGKYEKNNPTPKEDNTIIPGPYKAPVERINPFVVAPTVPTTDSLVVEPLVDDPNASTIIDPDSVITTTLSPETYNVWEGGFGM